jgi:hypothetical protein
VLAVDLGGLMIKVGQFLSSRLDVLPPKSRASSSSCRTSARRRVLPDPCARRSGARGSAGSRVRVVRRGSGGRGIPRPGPPRAPRGQRRADLRVRGGRRQVQRPGIDRIVETDLAAPHDRRTPLRIGFVADRVDAPRSSRSSPRPAARRSTICTKGSTRSGSPRRSPTAPAWPRPSSSGSGPRAAC